MGADGFLIRFLDERSQEITELWTYTSYLDEQLLEHLYGKEQTDQRLVHNESLLQKVYRHAIVSFEVYPEWKELSGASHDSLYSEFGQSILLVFERLHYLWTL